MIEPSARPRRRVLAALAALCLATAAAAAPASLHTLRAPDGDALAEPARGTTFEDCLFDTVLARSGEVLVWDNQADVDVVVGPLDGVRTYRIDQSFSLVGADSYDTSLDQPAPGRGLYYLVKHTTTPATCATARGPVDAERAAAVLAPSWDSGAAEQPLDRDAYLPDQGCNRDTSEAWVLSPDDFSFDVIDSCTETRIDGGDLATNAGTPGGIAFSTRRGFAGDYAFITQGSSVVIVDVATRSIAATVDLSSELGAVALAGVAAARVQDFAAGPTVDDRAMLYVAADLNGSPGFVVIDQARLIPTPAATVVADSGTFGVAGVALDVTPIAEPSADGFQRAWFTVLTPAGAGPASIRAVLVATPLAAIDWSVIRTITRTLPVGAAGPQTLEIGAGRLGESAILPEGPNGVLTDVEAPVTTYCSGGANSDQRSVSVRGPAIGGYRIFALDRTTLTTGVVRVYDETEFASGNCSAASVATGSGPVALDTFGQEFLVRGFTADRDGDTVTIVRDTGTTVTSETVSLGARAGACVGCPIDVETQETDATSCTVQNVVVTPDKTISWDAIGCAPPSTTFMIWCRCTEANPVDCQVCPPDPAKCPGCREIGDVPWEPVGIANATVFSDTVTGDESVEYRVAPNERQPVKLTLP